MLAIAGGKGGSGKTTTALGLATVMARQGLDPVVVDCDCDMPDLHHLLEIERTEGVNAVAAGASIERACQLSPRAPGVRCLPAGARSNVDAALSRVADWHDPVILDCPPGVGPDAVRPLRHAQQTVIVSTDQPESVADARTTAETARQLETSLAGAIVRSTAADRDADWTDRSPVLARIDSVEAPLDHPQVRANWSGVVQRIRSGSPGASGNCSPATDERDSRRKEAGRQSFQK
ncbi:MinD/ParA family ATP-binding protein [Halovenus sp. HT40]|uniref:MinD/ParA family ATP-binding protein n=1 Tax=Halovenus sp. HT40 TaxID=3126691 RepID=UPI00300EEBD9